MKKLCALALCLALCVGLLPSAAWAAGPEVKAKAVLLMEKSTGEILYEEHGEEPLELASVTKVMTMLLIMEALEDGTLTPDTMVAVSANAAGMGGSQVYMKEGETFSVHDMLKAIAVASGNDACVAMAEHLAGSEAAFVERMNARAAELGMENTVFCNCTGLPAEGYDRPSAFWTAMGQNKPKLILLDIMLPEEDGMVILRKLRADPATRAIPVMMLTAKGTEYDTVLALDAGADDYVQKPFRMMELLSRIRALLRRAETYGTPTEQVVVYRVGGLEVSPSCHLVKVNGQDIALTLKEFELLCLLLENRGIVLSRDKILDKVWGDTMGRESRTVDVHIRTLRQKLGPCGERIETVRGIGYKFQGEA